VNAGPVRISPRLEPFRLALVKVGLPAWFLITDLIWIVKPDVLGVDARHYQRAADVWLAGGDPWSVTEFGVTYASGPHTLLFYAPTSLLPAQVSFAFWMGLGVLASIWLVRRLGAPLWWVAFPPLAHAIWNGNPQTIVLALLILGGPIAGALATGFKLYAAAALLTKPRVLAVAIVALVVTLPIVPWQLYVADGFGIGSHLNTAWNASAWREPILVPPTLLALWILRRKGAEWYVVPAAWPATQFYYVSMVMPAVVKRPILAALLATPIVLMTPLVVMGLAAMEVWRDRRRPVLSAGAPATSTAQEPDVGPST
jgi:hypothetical protein